LGGPEGLCVSPAGDPTSQEPGRGYKLPPPGCRRRQRQRNAALPLQAPTGLFRFLQAGAGGKWEEVATNAAPQLYDAHEDSKKAPEWHLEVDGAQARAGCRWWQLRCLEQ